MNRSRTEYTQRANWTMDYIDSHLVDTLPLEKNGGGGGVFAGFPTGSRCSSE